MKDDPIRQSVAHGAAFLDERFPDWHNEIDVDALALEHCRYCILGQLVGDYAEARMAFNLSVEDAIECGFIVDRHRLHPDWDNLNKAWKDLILSRRSTK